MISSFRHRVSSLATNFFPRIMLLRCAWRIVLIGMDSIGSCFWVLKTPPLSPQKLLSFACLPYAPTILKPELSTFEIYGHTPTMLWLLARMELGGCSSCFHRVITALIPSTGLYFQTTCRSFTWRLDSAPMIPLAGASIPPNHNNQSESKNEWPGCTVGYMYVVNHRQQRTAVQLWYGYIVFMNWFEILRYFKVPIWSLYLCRNEADSMVQFW